MSNWFFEETKDEKIKEMIKEVTFSDESGESIITIDQTEYPIDSGDSENSQNSQNNQTEDVKGEIFDCEAKVEEVEEVKTEEGLLKRSANKISGFITSVNNKTVSGIQTTVSGIQTTNSYIYHTLVNRDYINDQYILKRSEILGISPDKIARIDKNRQIAKTVKYATYGVTAIGIFTLYNKSSKYWKKSVELDYNPSTNYLDFTTFQKFTPTPSLSSLSPPVKY